MAEFDNNEEDRGYETQLNFNDVFTTTWICVWFIPITVIFILMITNRVAFKERRVSKINMNTQSKAGKQIWTLGFIVCLFFYLREVASIVAWVAFIISFDYSETSIAYMAHNSAFGFWMLADSILYLFFIYRLYLIYNPTNQSILTIKKHWYFILITLNILYFLSNASVLKTHIVFYHELYVIAHSICLFLEITMYIILISLISRPMLNLTKSSRKITDDEISVDSPRSKSATEQSQEELLSLMTRINVLSSIALLTTVLKRVFDIASFVYCPDECWLTYINYNLMPIDSFMNIFCILCSFTTGKKYYDHWCKCIHNIILTKCIGSDITDNKKSKHLKDTDNNATSTGSKKSKSDGITGQGVRVPIELVNNTSNTAPPNALTIEDIATRSASTMGSRDRIASSSDEGDNCMELSKPYRSVGGLRVTIN